jgi:HPt (histidine-containing phosphotransfer) domain-containing protein
LHILAAIEKSVGGSSSMPASHRLAVVSDQTPTAIDEDHLGRMTLGDRALEREVLEIFVRQNTIMLDRIGDAEPSLAAAAAHTIKGSARGIGAWRVARAADWLEQVAVAGRGCGSEFDEAVAELKAASLEVSAAIGARLAPQ